MPLVRVLGSGFNGDPAFRARDNIYILMYLYRRGGRQNSCAQVSRGENVVRECQGHSAHDFQIAAAPFTTVEVSSRPLTQGGSTVQGIISFTCKMFLFPFLGRGKLVPRPYSVAGTFMALQTFPF